MPQETIKVGPDNWTAAVPLLLIAYRDATPQGKKQAEQEIKNIAKVADLVPDLVASLKYLLNQMEFVCPPNDELRHITEPAINEAKKALKNIRQ